MSKRKFQLVEATDNFNTTRRTAIARTDWERCLICQSDRNEKLVCPAISKRKDKYAGYKSLIDDIATSSKDEDLPFDLNSGRLRENNKGEFETFPVTPAKGFEVWKTRLKELSRKLLQKGRSAPGHHTRAQTSKRTFVSFVILKTGKKIYILQGRSNSTKMSNILLLKQQ